MARFMELAELFEELEKTTSHKEIVRRIANFYSELEGKEVRDTAYLFLGSIGPAFENPTLGVGDKLAIRAIAEAYGIPEEEVNKRYATTGDLGDVALELNRNEIRDSRDSLTTDDVFGRLKAIAEVSGKGSQDEKIRLLSEVLQLA